MPDGPKLLTLDSNRNSISMIIIVTWFVKKIWNAKSKNPYRIGSFFPIFSLMIALVYVAIELERDIH